MKTSNKLLLGLFGLILLTVTIVLVLARIELKDVNKNYGDSKHQESSGKLAHDQRNVDKFNKIEVESMIKVNYTQGTSQQVIVRADSNLVNLVISEVRDGKLYLYTRERLDLFDPIQVDVSNDSINDIRLSAGGIFNTTQAMKVTKLNGESSSGAIFEIEGNFNDLTVDMSAGCVANFKGICKNLEVSCSAGSVFNADNMVAEFGTFSASAGAVMNVNVTNEISVNANAGSVIKCSGKARAKNINVSSGAQFVN